MLKASAQNPVVTLNVEQNSLYDSVTLVIFDDPYVIDCGHSHEKDTLDALVKLKTPTKPPRCPCCRQPFHHMLPNLALKEIIDYALIQNPDLQKEQYHSPKRVEKLNALIDSRRNTELIVFLKAAPYFLTKPLNANEQTVLHRAAITGNTELLTYLATTEIDFNATDRFNMTALILAVCAEQQGSVDWLLAHQAQVHVASKQSNEFSGYTALHCAAKNNALTLCQLLLNAGAQIDIPATNGKLPLDLATDETYDFLYHTMLTQVNNENSAYFVNHVIIPRIQKTQETLEAVKECLTWVNATLDKIPEQYHASIFKPLLLVLNKKVVNKRLTCKFSTILHDFAAAGNLEGVKDLHRKGIDLNQLDVYHQTALMYAVYNKKSIVVDFLLEQNVNLNIASKHQGEFNGFTALHWAAKYGDPTLCEKLLNAGASIESQTAKGKYPLHIASEETCDYFYNILITNAIAKNNVNLAAQIISVRLEKHQQPQTLLELAMNLFAELNITDAECLAIKKQLLLYLSLDRAMVLLPLLHDVINEHCQVKTKHTLLHIAAIQDNIEACRLLLANGANSNALSVRGQKPKELAPKQSAAHLYLLSQDIPNGVMEAFATCYNPGLLGTSMKKLQTDNPSNEAFIREVKNIASKNPNSSVGLAVQKIAPYFPSFAS